MRGKLRLSSSRRWNLQQQLVLLMATEGNSLQHFSMGHFQMQCSNISFSLFFSLSWGPSYQFFLSILWFKCGFFCSKPENMHHVLYSCHLLCYLLSLARLFPVPDVFRTDKDMHVVIYFFFNLIRLHTVVYKVWQIGGCWPGGAKIIVDISGLCVPQGWIWIICRCGGAWCISEGLVCRRLQTEVKWL